MKKQKMAHHVETGSCFDATNTSGITIKDRPGGHGALPAKPVDVRAFSFDRVTERRTPSTYLKRGPVRAGRLPVLRRTILYRFFRTRMSLQRSTGAEEAAVVELAAA